MKLTQIKPIRRQRRWIVSPERARQKFNQIRAAILGSDCPSATLLVQTEFAFSIAGRAKMRR